MKREPPRSPPGPDPNDNKEILTMCKITEDGSQCEQASIAWSKDNPQVLEQFGGYSGYRPGNCMRKGYTQVFDVVKHAIPFLGEITTRHFKKSDQLQFKTSVKDDSLTLLSAPDKTSTCTMALICLAACLVAAFTVMRVRYSTWTQSEAAQQIYEALDWPERVF
jgi:hypothetical protein